MSVKKGDKIKVEYTGTLEDGTVFDSSEAHGQPLEFEVGSGQLIKGFDDAVVGMEVGEEKEIKIQPSEAYGDHNPELVKKVPKEQFPKEKDLKPGMILLIKLPNEIQVPVRIAEVTDDEITLDLNHPLAGKVLIFKIKVVEICS
jgi:FKBP-type peptidyl-prolyl cis-trans isomerase 2